jgi:D-alanyl-D-alanine dipeptidase
MGTPVDYLGALAEPKNETKYLDSGELTREQVQNRELLRTVMRKAGFRGISNEWWHFEASTRAEAQKKFQF